MSNYAFFYPCHTFHVISPIFCLHLRRLTQTLQLQGSTHFSSSEPSRDRPWSLRNATLDGIYTFQLGDSNKGKWVGAWIGGR